MPSIRIGFSTDFNLTSEQVGIGTTRPTARLDVRGQVRSDNASGSGGISTLTEYQGFLHSKQGIGNTVSIAQTTKGNLNSLSGELVISSEVTVSAGTSIGAGRLDSLTVTSSFDLPRGGSTNRPVAPEKGNTRFNQDLGQLEFYTGYEWRTVGSIDGSGRGRGVFGGGGNPQGTTIEFINVSTTGNTSNFGTLSVSRTQLQSCSSSTRGLFAGGYITPGTFYNVIDYITIASEGNAIDFGDLNVSARRKTGGGCSSSTRGLFAGGFTPTPTSTSYNNIDYVTIATIGNALDFGDLSIPRGFVGSISSPTRGIFAGGFSQPTPDITGWNIIESVTISSTGNTTDFGDLLNLTYGKSGVSNGTRGVFAGGEVGGPTYLNTLEYVTIATTGNSTYFGDLTLSRVYAASSSSLIRGVFGGGTIAASPSTINTNVMDYITINTAGNAQDFGDLIAAVTTITGLSDSHGGLGGF